MTRYSAVELIVKNNDGAATAGVVYEDDIEAVSKLVAYVNLEAWNGITVQDILDGEITGGSGNMTFITLSINGFIKFDDKTNTILTTTGNITFIAGSGGIDIGNLQTGKSNQPNSSVLSLVTVNGGDINNRLSPR